MQTDSFIVWRCPAPFMMQGYHFLPQTNAMNRLLLFNKPFQVLSQFTDRDRSDNSRETLAHYLDAPGYRAAGRLDYDSEGLLILTNDGALQDLIANPKHKQWKTYWVQVEGEATEEMCRTLERGLRLNDGLTLPARCKPLQIPAIWERNPPIRYRASVPDSWIELSICEGRNRQVRRMTAAVGFPTLRLIRQSVGPYSIAALAPGEYTFVDPVVVDSGAGKEFVDGAAENTKNSHKQKRRTGYRSAVPKAKATKASVRQATLKKQRHRRINSD